MDAYLPMAVYLGGLAATLVLACYLTPARWWYRPTLRNLGLVAVGTWTIGALMLHAFGGASRAEAAPPPAATAASAAARGPMDAASPETAPANLAPFRVHRDLNLRAEAGTGAARLATIPAGTMVTPTGVRHGDWWQVRADADGKTQTGWASSLWLRRQSE